MTKLGGGAICRLASCRGAFAPKNYKTLFKLDCGKSPVELFAEAFASENSQHLSLLDKLTMVSQCTNVTGIDKTN